LALAVLAGTTPPDPDSDDGYNDPANAPSKQQAGLQVAPLANPNLGTYHGSTKDGQTIWKDGSGNLYIELAASGQRVPVSANGTPLPQSQWKASYTIGQSDGGPGVWKTVFTPQSGCDYQCQVTGAPRHVEYVVNGMKFDGYDPATKKLIDAKDWSGYPPDFLIDKEIENGRAQLDKANGIPVEWRISDMARAEQMRKAFKDAKVPITVKYVPKK
jgi:hypothetical protein